MAVNATDRWYFFPDDGEGGYRLLAERVGVELREGDAVDIGGRPAIALGRAKSLGGGFKRLFTARIGGEDAGCEVAVLAYDNTTFSEDARAEWRDAEFEMLSRVHAAAPGCCPAPYVTGTVSRGDAMDERSPAIAEESLAGSTLEQIVKRNRTPGGIGADMDSRTAASYALAVANVLKRLRDKGAGTVFVHRDIKPANILIGPSREAVLLDWQTAVEDHLDETANISSVPSPSTRAFTAPERDRGPLWAKGDRGTWDAAQDIYSLGITMVYLRAFHQLGERLDCTDYLRRLGSDLEQRDGLGFDLLGDGRIESPDEADVQLAGIIGRCTEIFPTKRIGLDDLVAELEMLASTHIENVDVPQLDEPITLELESAGAAPVSKTADNPAKNLFESAHIDTQPSRYEGFERILFGCYKDKPILWRAMKRPYMRHADGQTLLVCEAVLTVCDLPSPSDYSTHCGLDPWLREFEAEAFTDSERNSLVEGPYLLSELEADFYFKDSSIDRVARTISDNSQPEEGYVCGWWLSSPALSGGLERVDLFGDVRIDNDGEMGPCGIRPAIWVKSDAFDDYRSGPADFASFDVIRDAIDSASEHSTVTLPGSISLLSSNLSIGKSITLDLGGGRLSVRPGVRIVITGSDTEIEIINGVITSQGTCIEVNDGGSVVLGNDLTVRSAAARSLFAQSCGTIALQGARIESGLSQSDKNASNMSTGAGPNFEDYAIAAYDPGSTISIESGTVVAGKMAIFALDGSSIEISGGTISGGMNCASDAERVGSSESGCDNKSVICIFGPSTSAAITGGRICSKCGTAIRVIDRASLLITGGLIDATDSIGGRPIEITHGAFASISGGAIHGEKGISIDSGGLLSVEGGTIVSTSRAPVIDGFYSIAVSGGHFSSKIAASQCKTGFWPTSVPDAQGFYSVVPAQGSALQTILAMAPPASTLLLFGLTLSASGLVLGFLSESGVSWASSGLAVRLFAGSGPLLLGWVLMKVNEDLFIKRSVPAVERWVYICFALLCSITVVFRLIGPLILAMGLLSVYAIYKTIQNGSLF